MAKLIRILSCAIILLVLFHPSITDPAMAQSLTCVDLLNQAWQLQGNNGDDQESQSLVPSILQDKDRLLITYNLHGLNSLGGDASAIIFEIPLGAPWSYISLANYGTNGLDGEQTAEILLSDFPNLQINHPQGGLRARFWYGSNFTVDIGRIQACAPAQEPTAVPTSTPVPTTTPSFTPFPTLIPTVTASPTETSIVVPPLPIGGVELFLEPWRLQAQSESSQRDQAVQPDVLFGKDTVRVTFDLHGLQALSGDACALAFVQGGEWRYVCLTDYGQNGLNGVQTISIPLSAFPGLDLNANIQSVLSRFWYNAPYVVDIYSVVVYPSQGEANTAVPTTAASTVPSVTQAPTLPPTVPPVGNLPASWLSADIGNPITHGASGFQDGVFSVAGAGDDIWETADQFQYVYQTVQGDGQITARILSQTATNDWAKAGVMIKQSALQGAAYALLGTTPSNGLAFQHSFTNSTNGQSYSLPAWVRLVRVGETVTAYTSSDGVNWSSYGNMTLPMSSSVTVGMFVNSHNGTQLSTATFDNVTVAFGQSEATTVPTNTPVPVQPTTIPVSTPVPVQPTAVPTYFPCPAGSGPDGITAGGYNPQKLTQDQRQWLFNIFGNSGTAPVGYGGQPCNPDYGSGDANFRAFVCRRAQRGPGGILPGGYSPQSLTQEQRDWLFHQFGNQGTAPVGYGGETCPVTPVPQCPSGRSPGGYEAGSYPPESLSQADRQWLWEQFYHTGTAPVGYGGEQCSRGGAPSIPPCPTGVGAPGGFEPTTLTQQQRNELYWAFGHSGEAPVGYGGEACYGGTMTLPSFTGGGTSNPDPTTPAPSLPTYSGQTSVPTEPGNYVLVQVDNLRLRAQGSTDAAILGYVVNGHYYRLLDEMNGWGRIEPPGWQEAADFGWVFLNGYTSLTVIPESSEPVVLPPGCSDNGNQTVTCQALWVNDVTGNWNDAFAGVFLLPHDVNTGNQAKNDQGDILAITLDTDNDGQGDLSGDFVCALFLTGATFHDGNTNQTVTVSSEYKYAQGCVGGVWWWTPNASSPWNWELTYRSN